MRLYNTFLFQSIFYKLKKKEPSKRKASLLPGNVSSLTVSPLHLTLKSLTSVFGMGTCVLLRYRHQTKLHTYYIISFYFCQQLLSKELSLD